MSLALDAIGHMHARSLTCAQLVIRGECGGVGCSGLSTRPTGPSPRRERTNECRARAGVDVLLATSKHNVQYLLGAERAIFFDYMDAIGVSRYLPILIYPKGRPDKAAFIGHRLATHQRDVAPLCVPDARTAASGSPDALALAVAAV